MGRCFYVVTSQLAQHEVAPLYYSTSLEMLSQNAARPGHSNCFSAMLPFFLGLKSSYGQSQMLFKDSLFFLLCVCNGALLATTSCGSGGGRKHSKSLVTKMSTNTSTARNLAVYKRPIGATEVNSDGSHANG